MVSGVSGSVSPRISPENLLNDLTGWSADRCKSWVSELEQAYATQDVDKYTDLMQQAQSARDAGVNTQPVQSGATVGTAAQGQGAPPAAALQSMDTDTLKRSKNAPNPLESIEAPTEEKTQRSVGDSAYDPAPGLPTQPDSPVRPAAAATSAAEAPQRLTPVGGVVSTGNAEATGAYSSVENHPHRIANRERVMREAAGVRLPNGQSWDDWEKARGKQLMDGFSDPNHPGMWQVNPDLMAREAAQRLEYCGLKLSPEQVQRLEVNIHNHFVLNGGLVRTGGEMAQFAHMAAMGGAMEHPFHQFGFGGSIAAPLIGGIIGSGAGAALGMVGGPLGMLAGGAIGNGLGTLAGALLSRPSMVNPALMMMPQLATNPVAMGMGGALGTLGMMSPAMMGGGMMGGGMMGMGMNPLGAMGAFMRGGPLGVAGFAMTGMEQVTAAQGSVQYGLMNLETRMKRLMHRQATLQGDGEMVRMLTSSNMPIEKLIAMWALKNCRRYEQELRDKMLAAEDARQREKQEKLQEEARGGGIGGMVSGLLGTVAPIAGMALGGPIGGIVGGMVGQAGSGLMQSMFTGGNLMGDPNGKPPESAAALQLEVQMALEEWKRSYELASNILKSLHDMAMTAINNTRG